MRTIYSPNIHEQEKKFRSLSNTNSWSGAKTSSFVVAFITLTEAKQSGIAATSSSSGSRSVPHVRTSGGVVAFAGKMRVSTKRNFPALVQPAPSVVAGKFTLSVMFGGRMGRAGEARSARVRRAPSAAYVSAADVRLEGVERVVKEIWSAVAAESAAEGTPSLAASHAAPLKV